MKNGLLFCTFLLLGCSSCKIVRSLAELRREKPQIYTYQWQDKTIAYLPMHHLGKPAFYEGVKQQVIDYKRNGYTVYYELVSSKLPGVDSLKQLEMLLKVRKIMGSGSSYKERVKDIGFFKKYVQQPAYPKMGTDSSDKRADVNTGQMVAEWERLNGPIVLDSLDRAVPISEKYERESTYSRKEFSRIVEDYRTAYLLQEIKAAPEKKILILYGKGHQKGFRKGLNQQ